MNREIKFRAWHKNKMINSNSCLYFVEFDGSVCKNIGDDYRDHLHYLEDVVLMQYTGLKDCNGLEIYEGDIVLMSYAPTYIERNRLVEWRDNGFYTYRKVDGACQFELLPLSICNDCRCKKIGNVYENPELLNQ